MASKTVEALTAARAGAISLAMRDPARQALEDAENTRAEVHPLDWQDDFGPFRVGQFTEFVVSMQAIERAQDDARQEHELCVKFGYRDVAQFLRVRNTFLKYWGDANDSDTVRYFVWKEPEFSKAIMQGMQLEQEQRLRDAMAANPSLLAPEQGVSLEQWAGVCSKIAGRDVSMAELQQLIAPLRVDIPGWERLNHAWIARMQRDTTGAITAAYTKAFMSSGGGQFGAAAQATAAAAPGEAPAGPEPMTLARYCEIAAAIEAWGKQGRDTNAMMQTTYGINAGDLSRIGVYWNQRFMSDPQVLGEYGRLLDQARARLATASPDADIEF